MPIRRGQCEALVDALHRREHFARGADRVASGAGHLNGAPNSARNPSPRNLFTMPPWRSRITTSTANAPSSRSTTCCGERERASAVKLRKSTNITATWRISLSVPAPSTSSRSGHLRRNVLAEQAGDAIARGRGRNAGGELAAQLNADRAGENPGDQDDHAARGVIPDVGRRIGGQQRGDGTSPCQTARPPQQILLKVIAGNGAAASRE